jgi:hypothetical protein
MIFKSCPICDKYGVNDCAGDQSITDPNYREHFSEFDNLVAVNVKEIGIIFEKDKKVLSCYSYKTNNCIELFVFECEKLTKELIWQTLEKANKLMVFV